MSEETQNEVETNPIQDMIQHALNKDYNKANDVFNGMMSVKMSDLLDQEQIRMADQVYNGVDPDEEDDDNQLDLDLESEEGGEEGEVDTEAEDGAEEEEEEEESSDIE